MQRGLTKDLLLVIFLETVLILLAILIAGQGFSVYVQRGLDDLVGGKDYQVVVQVEKQETADFIKALKETYQGREGFRFRVGKVLGDKIHILLGFGEQDLKNGALDEVTKLVSPLPGYAGLAPLLDPAVLVKGLPTDLYREIINKVNTWPETRYAAKGPMGLYVVAKTRKDLGVIEKKLLDLTSTYYVWEIELTNSSNREVNEAREKLEEALEGKKHWFIASPVEGVIGDAVRLLKSYSSKIVVEEKLPVGADLVLSEKPLKIGSKPNTPFRAKVFSDGIYLVKGDSLELTGLEKAYLLDGSGHLKEALSNYHIESPRKDLKYWEPTTDASEIKKSAEELITKINQGEDISLLLRDLEQLARNLNLKLPDEIKSKLEILILWDRIGQLPENFRAELSQKILDWVKTMPADPLLKLKDSLPSWSDEDIYKSWRDLESYSRQNTLRVVTTEKDPPIADVVSKPAADIKEDIKSQVSGVVGGVVPLAALAAAVILLWVFMALDHSLWGSYLLSKQNHFAPVFGWLLGVFEISVAALIMPFNTQLLVKMIYVVIGALGSALIITISNRISPLDYKSIEAGEALGLSKTELYRQVIVPSGRMGLWQFINKGKLLSVRRFKDA